MMVAQHDVMLKEHGRRLDEIKADLTAYKESNGEIAEMFGKIMAATTHAADQVVALDGTVKSLSTQVDRRLTEMKINQDGICALKHGALEQRLLNVEHTKEAITKRVEDMGDVTKVTYIRQLEAERDEAKKAAEQVVADVKTRKFEWSKIIFTSVIALLVAVASVLGTYALTRKNPPPAPVPVATK